jgi:hypothetical protein
MVILNFHILKLARSKGTDIPDKRVVECNQQRSTMARDLGISKKCSSQYSHGSFAATGCSKNNLMPFNREADYLALARNWYWKWHP